MNMVLNIVTDDFDNFYEIQDDLGRFVHFDYLFNIDNGRNYLGKVV